MAYSFPGPKTAPDFFFVWGYLKSKVCGTRPTDVHALKENIRKEIANLSEETLQAVMRSFLTRVHLCIEEPPKRHCAQKVKLCKKKVNCDMLKLVSITFSTMLFLFIIS